MLSEAERELLIAQRRAYKALYIAIDRFFEKDNAERLRLEQGEASSKTKQ